MIILGKLFKKKMNDISIDSPYRVIQVSAFYPPHLGGQEYAVRDLAVNLAKNGTDVEVVASDIGGKPGISIEDGVKVTRLHSTELAHTALIWGLFRWLLKNADRKTIVHVHVGQAFTPEIVYVASKIRGFKYIMQMHIEPVQSGNLGVFLPIYRNLFLKPALRCASIVAVLTGEHKKIVEEVYGFKGQIVVVSNAVNDQYFKLKRKAPSKRTALHLLFAGRLTPQKNLGELFKAVKLSRLNIKLDVVGDGELRGDLESLISELHLKNITLHGRIERDKVLDFYRQCDAFVLPSLYEAQPLVLLEAMAARVPLISTSVRGIAEHVKDCALLSEPTASAISKVLDTFAAMSQDEISAMVKHALIKVGARNWNKVSPVYRDIYEACWRGERYKV